MSGGPACSPASGRRPRRSVSRSVPGLLGGLLALAGYVSSSGDEVVAQSDTAVLAVRLGFSVVPALLVLTSLPVLARYRLDAVPEEAAA